MLACVYLLHHSCDFIETVTNFFFVIHKNKSKQWQQHTLNTLFLIYNMCAYMSAPQSMTHTHSLFGRIFRSRFSHSKVHSKIIWKWNYKMSPWVPDYAVLWVQRNSEIITVCVCVFTFCIKWNQLMEIQSESVCTRARAQEYNRIWYLFFTTNIYFRILTVKIP